MKRKRFSKMMMVVLSACLLGSSTNPISTMAQGTSELTTVKKAEDILVDLTPEQREALKQIEAKPTFKIAPNINTTNEKLVDVIVEFKQEPAKVELMKKASKGSRLSKKEASRNVEKAHNLFKEHLKSLKKTKNNSQQLTNAEIKKEYRLAMAGVAMTIPGNKIEALFDSGVVKRVWKDGVVQLPLPPNEEVEAESESKMMDSIPQINVDKLHKEQITGKGVKVGVLDTGIDYHHPDLQDAYSGGYDFIDNDSDPMETTYEDWKDSGLPETNPNSGTAYYTEHGTHVAGTIAGEQKNNAVDYAVKGVAPDVDLYSYRVLGPYGFGETSGILAGIDRAIADQMDVMNLSLGAVANDPLYPTSVAVNNAMLSGVVTVVAAGNSGPDEKTLSSPGTAALGITVGASDFAMDIPTFVTIKANDQTFENILLLGNNFSYDLMDLQHQSIPVVSAGLGYASDFEGKDFNGKIALVERGTIPFADKIMHAKEAGAEAAIIYNNAEGEIPAYLGRGIDYIPSFRMTKTDGERLKELGDQVSLTFGELDATETEGDHLAEFSSRGPVSESYDIKPDVMAPGVAIFSTIPEYIHSPEEGEDYSTAYTRMQGTSMATPHVAGVAALILQEHNDYSPFDVKAALMNTSEDLKGNTSVYEQGAGRVDAYNAVHADVSVKVMDTTENFDENGEEVEIEEETASLSFGTHYKVGEKIEDQGNIIIENDNKKDQTFRVKVEYHGEREDIEDSEGNGIDLEIPENIIVNGESSEEVTPKITVPKNAETGRYEGYIHFENTNDQHEAYQVPFAIYISEKGFEYLETDRPSLANNTPKWQHYNPQLTAAFQMKSPMSRIDIIVKDGQTGAAIGFVASVKDNEAEAGFRYYIPGVFSGKVYPFTQDRDNPISNQPIDLPEGKYLLEFIGYDGSNNSYTIDTPFVMDNTQPEVKFDTAPGVYELNEDMYTEEYGQKAYWIHGTIQDDAIDLLQSQGFDYDQSSNKFYFSQGDREYFGCCFPAVDSEGNADFGIEASDIEDEPIRVSLAASDIALNVNYQRYIFMKKGTEYLTSDYNKEEVKLGDTITMTLSVNNVKHLTSGKYNVEFKTDQYLFENAELNETFKDYLEERNLEGTLLAPKVNDSDYLGSVELETTTIEGESFTGLDGDMPLLDITFKVINDHWYYNYDKFEVTASNYTKDGQTEAVSLPYYSTSKFDFHSYHSEIDGYIKPEAFLSESSRLPNGVAQEIGAKVYAVSPNGEKYKGTIDARGNYTILGVPADGKEYQAVVDVPGHLKSYISFLSGYELDGNYYGKFIKPGSKLNLAGDVNEDSFIDIKDVKDIAKYYGEEDPKKQTYDVNQDGVINETDVRFIEKNFLAKGPDAPKGKSPMETIGKKDLNYYLDKMGLKPVSGRIN
ncbi:hypothetical protein M948_09240 [Virgibacillus sp. CM-4]|uniref:S8 family serine peptidase n=1 Tax=Virgibacillus sp. CM-4 TaxID=1354277 RepID=UPI00038888B4|nr:S8 family serine peptidase [Virgibacillus sp. CM-4]EQB37063.1 hypothetical protein M948_09240 [Virgibacillus sp. CM-4]